MTGLLLDSKLSEEHRNYVEMLRSSGDLLLGLINDILDFSKIEAGKLDIEKIEFDLRNTIEETAEFLALRAHEKGLALVCRIDPGVHTFLIGNPGRLAPDISQPDRQCDQVHLSGRGGCPGFDGT